MKRLPLITSIVICVGAIATIVLNVLSCRNRAALETPPEAAKPKSAAERTQELVDERGKDPEYTNGLARLARHQEELGRLRNEVLHEFESWRGGFVASNAEARAIFDQLQALAGPASATNEAFAALAEKFEAMVAADPQGKHLLDKRDTIQKAIEDHQASIREYIGANVRRQVQEHAAAAPGAGTGFRPKFPGPQVKPPTRKPAPRKDGWWTNQPPAAGSSGLKVGKSESPGGPGAVPAASSVSGSGGPGAVSAAAGGNTEPETRNPKPGTK